MTFDLNHTIGILHRTPQVLKALLKNVPEELEKVNEGGDTWTAFDIVGHLIHGEKTDWISRMEIILSDRDDKTFVPFDRFAQFKESIGKTLDELLDEFERLRNQNLSLLKDLDLTDDLLELTGNHPDLGEVTLRELLVTWAMHDLNHLNQLTRTWVKANTDNIGPWGKFMKRVIKS